MEKLTKNKIISEVDELMHEPECVTEESEPESLPPAQSDDCTEDEEDELQPVHDIAEISSDEEPGATRPIKKSWLRAKKTWAVIFFIVFIMSLVFNLPYLNQFLKVLMPNLNVADNLFILYKSIFSSLIIVIIIIFLA